VIPFLKSMPILQDSILCFQQAHLCFHNTKTCSNLGGLSMNNYRSMKSHKNLQQPKRLHDNECNFNLLRVSHKMSNHRFHHDWQCQIAMTTKTLNLILKQKWINKMKVIEAFNNTKSCKMTIQLHQFCKQHLNKGEQRMYFTKSQWKKFLHTFFCWIHDVKNEVLSLISYCVWIITLSWS
jgi:hypothetical protein